LNRTAFTRVVEAITELGLQSFILLDKAEPEFETLDVLRSRGIRPQLIALVGISTGLIDYQLSVGGATKLWKELEGITTQWGLSTLTDAKKCMGSLLSKSVSSQYNDQKARRISKVFSSDLPQHVVDRFEDCLKDPVKLWNMIAVAVGSSPEKKTIAFSMKVFDLAVFCCYGKYLEFSQEPPIAVDFHVRRMTEIMGLTSAGSSDDQIRHIWFEVALESSKKAMEQISPLRIDSLIWQSGLMLYDPLIRMHSKSRLPKLDEHLGRIGIDVRNRSSFMQLLQSCSFA